MRILILTAIPFWHPGTNELLQELRNKGISVEALDIFHGRKINKNGDLIDLIKLPGILRKIYLYFFRQSFVNKQIDKDVVIDIHFVEPHYSKYLLHLPNKIICSLFGSDLFRTDVEQKKLQKNLFNKAKGILLSKNMISEFEKFFPGNDKKFFLNQYGSKRIDLIVNNHSGEKAQVFNFPENKKIVCCAYNGKIEQQHIKTIDALNLKSDQLSGQIHLVFPLTYGGNSNYIQKIENKLKASKFTYTLITKRLSDEEIVQLWQRSDLCINMQTTDALSSSIKEAMAARNIMLIGQWLPYEVYSELGIKFEKVEFSHLADSLLNVLSDFKARYDQTRDNAGIISRFASWEYLIDNWIDMYHKVEKDGE